MPGRPPRWPLVQNPRRRFPRRRWPLFRIVLLLVVLSGATGGAAFYHALTSPRVHAQQSTTIVIPAGSTAAQIVALLGAHEIIASPLLVRTYLSLTGRGSRLKAGSYRFPSPISALGVIQKLLSGDVYTERITFPEGLTRFDVADMIAQLPITDAEKAHDLVNDTNLIADLDPQADSLEGYLFPDTYEYDETTTAEQLIEKMVRRFRQVWRPEYLQRARELRMTLRQVVTLASLIEKEAKLSSERALISSVFHNRLLRGMKLECDPTVLYAARLVGIHRQTITKSDLMRLSPYNTYLFAGPPPGPIASPGLASLEAALYPADTDFLYFVVDGSKNDGSHRFAVTPTEHAENVALYRRSLQDQQKMLR